MELNIQKIIEDQVRHELADMDIHDIVAGEVRRSARDGLVKEMNSAITSTAQEMIAEEISRFLSGEVHTDDGWGKKASYESFEKLFRSEFKKAMDQKYEVKREIEKQVSSRVNALVKQDFSAVIEKIVDELTCSKLLKKS